MKKTTYILTLAMAATGLPAWATNYTDTHITDIAALQTEPIDLKGCDDWLVLEGIKPSELTAQYAQCVTIDGVALVPGQNARLDLYGSGTVIIPYGPETDAQALTIFDQAGCQGQQVTLDVNYHKDLAEWDNRAMSFRLKRGYMATFANNNDGTGHSRVWIADTDDIEVDLPEGFVTLDGTDKSFVSFVRVLRWHWPGKKGWAGWTASEIALSGVDCYYTWSSSPAADTPEAGFYGCDVEYSPIKQNRWWPSWDEIQGLTESTHVLGYNEPDHADQANLSYEIAIDEWPNMMKSGLRVGSPAPDSAGKAWLKEFMDLADELNYRVDFAVCHVYEHINIYSWGNRINTLRSNAHGRPCWITEANNGANWTGENWPDKSGTRVDVHGNPILDENGNEQTVSRPATADNMAKQLAWIEELWPVLEDNEWLERWFVYNWVEDARAFILEGELTPAGEYYANYISSNPGYRAESAYDHIWKIAPPRLKAAADDNFEIATITLYDHNGETGKSYDLYRKVGTQDWEFLKTLVLGVDYQAGDLISYQEEIPGYPVEYRAMATAYDGRNSEYSRTASVEAPALGRPTINVIACLGEEIVIGWDEVNRAEDYTIARSTSQNGEYANICEHFQGTEYHDATTVPETVYWYKVGANSAMTDTTWSFAQRIYSGVSGIVDALLHFGSITVKKGAIHLQMSVPDDIILCDLSGKLIRYVSQASGTVELTGLAPGTYILNQRKVFVP